VEVAEELIGADGGPACGVLLRRFHVVKKTLAREMSIAEHKEQIEAVHGKPAGGSRFHLLAEKFSLTTP
jgi:hypothetical protein